MSEPEQYLGMDNRTIDITSRGREAFKIAMRLAWDNCMGGEATGYRIDKFSQPTTYYWDRTKLEQGPTHHDTEMKLDREKGTETFILFWSEGERFTSFPFPQDLVLCQETVWGWLSKRATYPRQPDHDGDNVCGWRIFNERWGHVIGESSAFIAIQPAWAMLGK